MTQIQSFEAYLNDYRKSVEHPEEFWGEVAEDFFWKKKWNKVLDWNFTEPSIKWFEGAELNLSENCLDRHLTSRGNQTAIIWEPNDPNEPYRTLTYKQLHIEVCRFANVLKNLKVNKGDRVCIYMPMIPEAAVAMLACARIGAIHSVVFAGFSANSLIDRINDSQCSLVITADAVFRGEKKIELKKIVDEALSETPSIKNCIVFNHRQSSVKMKEGRDIWWHDLIQGVSSFHAAETMSAEDPLFILYTSGSTGKPKGMLHTTAGYMVYAAYTFENIFNYQDGEVFCCTADIGWVTGHTYLIYGPLLNGATTIMFEGVPNYPDHGRFWELVDKHWVNIFYIAPTAIRSLQAKGEEIFKNKNLSSLRVLGTVGEPINEEAWQWYHENVGKKNCPIVDTWWQTETGGALISPIATVTRLKPTYATLPLPGIQPVLMDELGEEIIGNSVEGNLCIKFPWPGMARTVFGDHERFRQTYFSTYKGYYFTGDGCRRDDDGYYRITGRVDDVINVSGHRIGTGEVEDAIDEHGLVVESAVVGYPHDIKGQGIYAFVICNRDVRVKDFESFQMEIRNHVSKIIGPFARPDKIQIVKGLPKTRSGKIMRRILRKIAEGNTTDFGDTTTLLDPSVVEEIVKGV
ncbi:MAG: acetate--CoA ligase [Bacteroidetes bacterium]|nr:acetate--CoA ligase [Bacteroidota bacterium]